MESHSRATTVVNNDNTKQQLVVVMNTHGRIRETMDSIKLLRESFKNSDVDLRIILEFNGDSRLLPKDFAVDHLFISQPLPHYSGAIALINSGISHALKLYPNTDYFIQCSGDVRLSKTYIVELLDEMKTEKLDALFSLWFPMGFSTECSILNRNACERLFPFAKTHYDNWIINQLLNKSFENTIVEILFMQKALTIKGLRYKLMPKREFVAFRSRFVSEGYDSSHYN